MDSNTFVKWLFSPKDSAAMSDPDLASPSPSESHPISSPNVPPDTNQAAENAVTQELERLDLQGSCSIEVERGFIGEAENETAGEQAVEVEEAIEEEEEEEEEEEQSENENWSETEKEGKYPVRPGAEDCAYYMRTGACKFGSNCRFNHPSAFLRKVQAGKDEADHGEAAKYHLWQVECKYYLSPGGCKFGRACKFSHSRSNLAAPTTELNFLGLPIRPGEKECEYFMRTGTCKYAANCRFNHPDPTSTAGGDNAKPTLGYSSSRSRLVSPPPPAAAQFPASATSWSPSVGTMTESTPHFVPMMYPSTTQSSKAEWNNGYQFPVNQAAAAGQSSSMAPRPPYIMHNSTAENHMMYANSQQQQQQQQQHQMVMNEYPERPGQPECTYFMRNGDCKFKSNCKFHHPKERISKSPHHAAVAFSNHGLPLRTDQNICTHYSRYGICRFGPSCKFDHPANVDVSRNRRIDHQQSSFGTSSSRATGHSGGAWPNSKPQVISL